MIDAVREWISKNHSYIYWIVHRGLRRHPEIRTHDEMILELSQDLVCSMLEKADQYDPERGTVGTWAGWRFMAILSKRKWQLAKETRTQFVQLDEDVSSCPDNSLELARAELIKRTNQSLARIRNQLTLAELVLLNIRLNKETRPDRKRYLNSKRIDRRLFRKLRKSKGLKQCAELLGVGNGQT